AGAAGVLVAAPVGVPGARAGMVSTCPSASVLGSAMLLVRTMSSTVTPNCAAMPDKVSPDLTLYVVGGTVGCAGGVKVGVEAGVISSFTRSPLPEPLSHPTSA